MSIWSKLKTRKKLIKIFKSGNLFLGSPDYPIFPNIQSVTINDQSTKNILHYSKRVRSQTSEKEVFCI